MLAKSIVSILPPMSKEEAIETTKIYSYNSSYQFEQGLIYNRPFRAPHHSITDIALIGGGTNPRPGEISLAHNGVLFLDELPEFNRAVIEVLRQPMEDGYVQIARAQQSIQFPCRFLLIAAMNACPCGYKYHPNGKCNCNEVKVANYFNKISGPLLDRIDMQMMVDPVPFADIKMNKMDNSQLPEEIERIQNARNIQFKRFEKDKECFNNAQMSSIHLKEYCTIDNKSESLLEKAMIKYQLSARAYTRILKVARTIADLDNSEGIELKHMSEAIQFRSLDKENENKVLP
jgi:magnesium chelatase family protein